MQKTITKIVSNRAQLSAGLALALLLAHSAGLGAQLPVNLGTAGNYVILTKSGVSTVPPSAVTGAVGVSPVSSTAITGFSLIMDASGQFSTSSQVTGNVYGPDYATPTPANLTTAVGDMQTAYTDAAGRTLPDHTELGSGNIGGMTLAPGLYKWGTGVTIPTGVTLAGGPNDVWIFQISGDLTVAGATAVTLSGGAKAGNIFWQVAGGVGVNLGTTSHLEGTILAAAAINLQTGAIHQRQIIGTDCGHSGRQYHYGFPSRENPKPSKLRFHHPCRKRHRDPRHHQHAGSRTHASKLHRPQKLDDSLYAYSNKQPLRDH